MIFQTVDSTLQLFPHKQLLCSFCILKNPTLQTKINVDDSHDDDDDDDCSLHAFNSSTFLSVTVDCAFVLNEKCLWVDVRPTQTTPPISSVNVCGASTHGNNFHKMSYSIFPPSPNSHSSSCWGWFLAFLCSSTSAYIIRWTANGEKCVKKLKFLSDIIKIACVSLFSPLYVENKVFLSFHVA